MERVLIKILTANHAKLMIFAEEFLKLSTGLDKIYCNIYQDMEMSFDHKKAVYKFEADRTLHQFSEKKALQLFAQRFDSGRPFFLDVFSFGKESLTVIKFDTQVLFYIVLEIDKFEREKDTVLKRIHEQFKLNLGVRAYIASLENHWFYTKTKAPIAEYWRHLMYQCYNTQTYDQHHALERLKQDEIWQPSCWAMWFSENDHDELINKLLCYKHDFLKIKLNKQSLFIQLYDKVSDSNLPVNQMKCREFSLYLSQFYPFEW